MFSKICRIIIRDHIIQKYKLFRLVLDFIINLGFLSPIVAIEIKKEKINFLGKSKSNVWQYFSFSKIYA
jgi:hypothetical protein